MRCAFCRKREKLKSKTLSKDAALKHKNRLALYEKVLKVLDNKLTDGLPQVDQIKEKNETCCQACGQNFVSLWCFYQQIASITDKMERIILCVKNTPNPLKRKAEAPPSFGFTKILDISKTLPSKVSLSSAAERCPTAIKTYRSASGIINQLPSSQNQANMLSGFDEKEQTQNSSQQNQNQGEKSLRPYIHNSSEKGQRFSRQEVQTISSMISKTVNKLTGNPKTNQEETINNGQEEEVKRIIVEEIQIKDEGIVIDGSNFQFIEIDESERNSKTQSGFPTEVNFEKRMEAEMVEEPVRINTEKASGGGGGGDSPIQLEIEESEEEAEGESIFILPDIFDNEQPSSSNLFLSENQDEDGEESDQSSDIEIISTVTKTPVPEVQKVQSTSRRKQTFPTNAEADSNSDSNPTSTKNSNKEEEEDENSVENSLKVLRCVKCRKYYPTIEKMKWHVGILHAPQGPKKGLGGFQCEVCDKKFLQIFNLKRHFIHYHNGVKLYECPCCDFQFHLKVELELHLEIGHKDL